MTAETVLAALAAIRAPQARDEYDLHGLTADALRRADIPFHHEAPLAPRCRVDFLCGTVGIEIKRGRPDKTPVEKQLRRYAETGKLTALVLLSEKALPSLPGFVCGIPVYPVSLYKLWGIATDTAGEKKAETVPEPPLDIPMEINEEAPPESASPLSLEDSILRDLSQEDIPPFLRDGEPASYYYGVLSYNARRKCWVIKGDPTVTELAKRLFPGSDAKRGEARFTAHRRVVGDVSWLMQRYPLEISPEIRNAGGRP